MKRRERWSKRPACRNRDGCTTLDSDAQQSILVRDGLTNARL